VAAGECASHEELAELCRIYWYPLYALARRKGHDPADSQDLTQSYFARLLERGVVASADPAKGRFRAFLRTDFGFFLADQRDRAQAKKRGGGVSFIAIDARDAEGRYQVEPSDNLTPDRLFDRAWALAVIDRALDRITREYEESGRSALFEHLKQALTDGPDALPYATIAERLGTTEVAVQSAIQRLRRRFRDLVREQVAETLDDPASVDDEIRALFAALGRI
jgi:RNA polymerase sigma-70 factor (ECF subfamily)